MAGARRHEANQDRSAEQDQGLVKSLSTGGAWATTGAEVDRTGLVGNKGDASHSHLCETILQDGFDLKQYESRLLELAVQRVGGNLTHAAKLLGITRRQLAYRLKQGVGRVVRLLRLGSTSAYDPTLPLGFDERCR